MKSYTREEVSSHKTDKDLWLIINDKVYDFSGYAKCHPGGPKAFYEFAGRDATESYEDALHGKWVDMQLAHY